MTYDAMNYDSYRMKTKLHVTEHYLHLLVR